MSDHQYPVLVVIVGGLLRYHVSANCVRTCYLKPKFDGNAHVPASKVTSASKNSIHTLKTSCSKKSSHTLRNDMTKGGSRASRFICSCPPARPCLTPTYCTRSQPWRVRAPSSRLARAARSTSSYAGIWMIILHNAPRTFFVERKLLSAKILIHEAWIRPKSSWPWRPPWQVKENHILTTDPKLPFAKSQCDDLDEVTLAMTSTIQGCPR